MTRNVDLNRSRRHFRHTKTSGNVKGHALFYYLIHWATRHETLSTYIKEDRVFWW
jgi:hypothetical protein